MRIAKRFALQHRLGHGGMGRVWLARDRALGIEVAVKLLGPELEGDHAMLLRFAREAEIGERLNDEHIVKVLAHGALEDGLPYIVMEHVDGEDLHRRLRRCGRLSLRDTRSIVAQVCAGLRVLHGAGVVHRDIKPANILLGETWSGVSVKLADFGLSWESAASPLTQKNVLLGTPLYMSPERLTDQELGPDCDLWALAVVAYECLTGRPPFAGNSYGAICIAIGRGQMSPPTVMRPDLWPELDAWFARALDPIRERRFGSATELERAFAAACDRAVRPEPPPPPPRLRRIPRRARALPLATTLLALTMLLACPGHMTPSAPCAVAGDAEGPCVASGRLAEACISRVTAEAVGLSASTAAPIVAGALGCNRSP